MTDQESSASKPSPLKQKGGSLPRKISPTVLAAYSALRPSEQRVADFVLSRPAFAMSLSARELGAMCHTSEATVVRFCQGLGYRGLTDFRAALLVEIATLERQSFLEIGLEDGPAELISKVVGRGTQVLQSILLELKPREFEKAVKAMARAKTLLLFGAGGSAYLASHISLEFIRVGAPIKTFIDYFSQMRAAQQLGKGDVAFGISYSGVTQGVIDVLTTARDGGATTICLTNYSGAPITKAADIKLTTGSATKGFVSKGGYLGHKIGLLIVLESLVIAVALQMIRTVQRGDNEKDATG